MTAAAGSLYPEDWKKTARKDFHRAEVLLKDADAEGASFFLQQMLEKYLKAFLIGKGWQLRKIHELDTLLDFAIEYAPGLEKFMDLCEKTAGYYLTERYPMLVSSGLTCDDIADDLKAAVELTCCLFPEERSIIEEAREGATENTTDE